jgi:hypothetical protein
MSDGTGYLLYAHATPRRWTSIKQSLAFCKLSQDADDEGIFRLDRLPNEAEAEAILGALGVRKRRRMSADQIERARSLLASARTLVNRSFCAPGSVGEAGALPHTCPPSAQMRHARPADFIVDSSQSFDHAPRASARLPPAASGKIRKSKIEW